MPADAADDDPRPLTPPAAWRARLAEYGAAAETIGRSAANVWRLEAAGRPGLFVKAEPIGPFAELPGEAERLRWLGLRGVACPRVIDEVEEAGGHWVLMSAVPGRDLASSPDLSPEAVVEIAASALRDLHARPIDGCPFDHRVVARIAVAQARARAGEVDESDFDEEWLGRTALDLFAELSARRPQGPEDLVLTHGDACLPNLIAQAGRFAGFVDCGRAGVADRCQDLALAARSVEFNLGAGWGEAFLAAYGRPVDRERLAFYRLLDEFF